MVFKKKMFISHQKPIEKGLQMKIIVTNYKKGKKLIMTIKNASFYLKIVKNA
jgi:hypothetical protein